MNKIGFLILLMIATTPLKAETICAIVKIEIRQELSFERQAFDAQMIIRNGLDVVSLENLNIDVNFADIDGNPVLASSDPNNTNAKFFIRIDTIDGVNDIDGSGVIVAGQVAEIHWLIIPAPGTGGLTPSGLRYAVGATVSYTYGEESQTVNVVPDFITVSPTPLLKLDYFLPTDVFGDNPLTTEVESIEPFELGLRISNTGAGFADDLKIESAQPVITENDQGLLIDFELLGTSVNDQNVTNSLLADIGRLDAGDSAMVSWLMQSSINGEFVSFEADFAHSDELGGQLTSLIDAPVDTHILFHKVKVDYSGRDQISDFLAYDQDVLRVYESNGTNALVSDESNSTSVVDLGVANGKQKYQINFAASIGANFVRWVDPFNGVKQNATAFRSDGKLLPSNNIWQYRIETAPGVFEFYFGLFDVDSSGQYEIINNGMTPNVAPVVTVTSPQIGEAGTQMLFNIDVSDANPGDIITLVSIGAPTTSSVSVVSGSTWQFSWFPELADVGTINFVLSASDGTTQTDTQLQLIISAPAIIDTDVDGMADDWEQLYFGSLIEDADGDFDLDSATNLQEHDFGGDPTLEDRPDMPQILNSFDGAMVNATVDGFTVINSNGAVDASMVYQFELYANQMTELPLAIATVNEATVQTTWTHGLVLDENIEYILRVRAFDGVTASVWNYDSFIFSSIDDAPTACAIDFPTNTQLVASSRPYLSVISATDIDSNNLQYRFKIYTDATMLNVMADSGWLQQSANPTKKWQPYINLVDAMVYYWSAQVRDQTSVVECGNTAFTTDFSNVKPAGYTLEQPQLDELTDINVDLVVNHDINSTNATNYSYYFELDNVADFSSVVLQQSLAVTADASNKVVWPITNLDYDKEYYWRVRADDGSQTGQWLYGRLRTHTSLLDPVIVNKNPSQQSWVTSLNPRLDVAANIYRNDIASYSIEIYADAAATILVHTENTTEQSFVTPLLNDRQFYFWQAKTIFNDATESLFTPLQRFFTIDDGVDELPYFEFLSLTALEENTLDSYDILWLDSDEDSNATIALYYDTDSVGSDGVLIVDGLFEDDITNSFAWDISSIEDGFYYIYAVIDDGENSATIYANKSLLVSHHEITVNPSSTTTSETGDSVTVSFALNKAPIDYVIIPLSVSNTAEASINVDQLVFTPLNWQDSQQIIVTGLDDAIIDGDQAYNLEFGSIESVDLNYTALSLASIDMLNIDDEINVPSEYDALVALYNSTDGANWINSSNWLVGDPCVDDWFGVTCDATDTLVTRVNLASNNLVGVLPSELSSLINLIKLDLNFNQLVDGIPLELGNLSQLIELLLRGNQLSGSIPIELGNLSNLKILLLGSNLLSGSIPIQLGNLGSLEQLLLDKNQLTGSIPSEIGGLSNLIRINLTTNQLTGTIPAEIASLSNLITLELYSNQLSGTIPLEIGNLSSLVNIQLQFNELTGSIPTTLGNLNNLSTLILRGNQLTGLIPSELGNLTNLSILNFGSNQLSGSIPPDLGNIGSLTQLFLNDNQLSGEIPTELGNLNSLIRLGLNLNQLTGSIPKEIGNINSLVHLYLEYNQLSGKIPTELGNLSSLTILHLYFNQLSGEIPTSIGKLIQLNELQFRNNNLGGEIPVELMNLVNISNNGLSLSFNKFKTSDVNLDAFLDNIHNPSDWSISQTIAPINLAIDSTTPSTVKLTWNAIEYTGNVGRYSIYYSIKGTNNFVSAGSTSTKFVSSFIVNGIDTTLNDYDFFIQSETDSHPNNSNNLISHNSEVVSLIRPIYVLADVSQNHTPISTANAYLTENTAHFKFIGPGTVTHDFISSGIVTNSYGAGLHDIVINEKATSTWTGGLLFLNMHPSVFTRSANSGNYWLYVPNSVVGVVDISSDIRLRIFDQAGQLDILPGTDSSNVSTGLIMVHDPSMVGNHSLGNINPFLSPYHDKMLMLEELAIVDNLNYLQVTTVNSDTSTLLTEIDTNLAELEILRVDITTGQYSAGFPDLAMFSDPSLMSYINSAKKAYAHISRSNFLDREDLVLANVIPLHSSGTEASSFKTRNFASFVFVGPGTVNIDYYDSGTIESKVFGDSVYHFSINENAITTWSTGQLFLNSFPEVYMVPAASGDYFMYVPSFVAGQVQAYSDIRLTIWDEVGRLDILPGVDSSNVGPGQIFVHDVNISGHITTGNINKYLSPYENIMLMPKDVALAEGLTYTDLSSKLKADQEQVLKHLDEAIDKLKLHKKAAFYYQFQ